MIETTTITVSKEDAGKFNQLRRKYAAKFERMFSSWEFFSIVLKAFEKDENVNLGEVF